MSYRPSLNDVRYLFIVCLLLVVAVLFGIMMYRIGLTDITSSQGDKNTSAQASDPDSLHNKIISTFEDEVLGKNSKDSALEKTLRDFASENAQSASSVDEFDLPDNSDGITVVNTDPRAYNARDEETLGLRGAGLISTYFFWINEKRYAQACGLLSKSICNTARSISGFTTFLDRLEGGYTVEEIYKAKEQKSDAQIFCVEYAYRIKWDSKDTVVRERMQYRLAKRPDGGYEISARVCEKKSKWGLLRPCPIETTKRYCDKPAASSEGN